MSAYVLDIEGYLAHQILCCYHGAEIPVPFWEEVLDPFIRDKNKSMVNIRSYHMLDFNDFAEFATSDLSTPPDLSFFHDNHIYFFQSLPGTFDDGLFESAFGYNFSIVGAAIATKGDDLSIMVQIRYLDREGFHLYPDVLNGRIGRKYFNRNHFFPYEFFYLYLTENTYSNDLAEKIKCKTCPPILVGDEMGMGMQIQIIDDSLIEFYKEKFGEDSELLKPENLKLYNSQINQHKNEFEFSRLFLQLPAYFDFMYDLVIHERRKVGTKRLSYKRKKNNKNKAGKPIYKLIKSLRVIYEAEEETRKKLNTKKRTWTAPAYKFIVRGHWRKLQYPWSKGHDPQGNKIVGKTWVREYEKGDEKEKYIFEAVSIDPGVTIKLKQTLSYAKDVLKSYDLETKKISDKVLQKEDITQIKDEKVIDDPQIKKAKPDKEWMYSERIKLTSGLRYLILKRDNFKCALCGRGAEDNVKLEIDHINPISNWGKTVESNLRTLCRSCNQGKGVLT